MAGKSKVWFVDDLPRNLEKFAKNHAADFDVTTFPATDAVLKRIVRGDLPNALLCDVFFYDTVEEAERVERKIDDLAKQLRDTAIEIGVIDHTRALGIRLCRRCTSISETGHRHFQCTSIRQRGHFYSSKKIGRIFLSMERRYFWKIECRHKMSESKLKVTS